MSKMLNAARRFARDRRGQTATEYVVLTGLATGIAVLAANLLGLSLRQAFQQVAQRMLTVITGS